MRGKISVKAFVMLLFAFTILLVGGHKVSAGMVYFPLNPNPPSPGDPGTPGEPPIPPGQKDALRHCNYRDSGDSPAYRQWISAAGSPAATSVTVPYNTQDVPLDLQWASSVCLNFDDVEEARLFTKSAVVSAVDGVAVPNPTPINPTYGSIFGAAGKILPLFSGNNYGDYSRSSYEFKYQLPSGLKQSHKYTISFVNKSINKFKPGTPHPPTQYQCIGEIARHVDAWEENDLCEDNLPDFDIQINVSPEPPGGNLDNAVCSRVSGWAKNPQFTSKPLVVKIYRDNWPENGGIYINQAFADKPRGDATPGSSEPTIGNHGFDIDISAANDVSPHKFYAVAQMLDSGGEPNGGFYHLGDDGKSTEACVKVNCSLSTIPAQPLVNQPFSIILSYNFDRPFGSEGKPITPRFSVSYNRGPNQDWGSPGPTQDPGSHTFSGFTQSGPGSVGSSGTVYEPSVFTVSCISGFNIAAAPYLKVFGNDIAAGGKFADKNAKECSANPDGLRSEPPASIWTFNKKVSSNFYGGGSSQFAAFAYGIMDQFNTAGTRNGQSTQPTTPSGLSFGNMVKSGNAPAAAGENQTGLSGMWNCIPDYFSASSKLPAAGASLRAGDISINELGAPTSIATGEKRVDFIKGNAFVKSNISYSSSNKWTSTAQIPNYYLIVKGDIYIASDVTALDGVYIAQPRDDGTGGGNIYTCTNGIGGIDWLYNKSDLYTGCQKSLTVTGSFIAKHISFQRSRGTVENSTSGSVPTNEGPTCAPASNTQCNIGEIFNFSQELYLALPPPILSGVTNTGNNSKPYDSITSLPPIL